MSESSSSFRGDDLCGKVVRDRYQIGTQVSQRSHVVRYNGLDLGSNETSALPISLLIQHPGPPSVLHEIGRPHADRESIIARDTKDLLEEESIPPTLFGQSIPELVWPNVSWEKSILEHASHLSLPRIVDFFEEGDRIYLIEEIPMGKPLSEAWGDRGTTSKMRYTWLLQIAEALVQIHSQHAVLCNLNPQSILITPMNQAAISDLTDLMPFPLPRTIAPKRTFFSAPELFAFPERVDARSDYFSFGAMIYALLSGSQPQLDDVSPDHKRDEFFDTFPDIHPFLSRLICKTFVSEQTDRFPVESYGSKFNSPSYCPLIQSLESCIRNLERVRLDVSSWSSTGTMRDANEDAVSVLVSQESRLEETDEFALLLLADGMGGMESGEIAAAMAVQTVRRLLLSQPPFAGLQSQPVAKQPHSRGLEDPPLVNSTETQFPVPGNPLPSTTPGLVPTSLMVRPEDRLSFGRMIPSIRERLGDVIRETNEFIFECSRLSNSSRGMGCTLEAVLIDGPHAVIAHVGDSRIYLCRGGQLKQLTRDQTLVSRLMELGHLSPAEAENHPRRSELQQAIGGRYEVYPDLFDTKLEPGDWLLICSDGLSNVLKSNQMEMILNASTSADQAARCLINQTIRLGAPDNLSVIVVRVV